ncbi:MAG TPA: leucyl aminopeptidase [Acidimicrobiales bacterium]|nr:leucyl aminopeptidase [Acidimicrobiales bacterium]
MTIELDAAPLVPPGAVAIARGVFSGPTAADGAELDEAFLERNGFSAKLGETFVLRGSSGSDEILVGLGERDRIDPESLRRFGAGIARASKNSPSVHVDVSSLVSEHAPLPAVAAWVGEGAILAAYRFDRFKSEPQPDPTTRLVIVGATTEAIAEGIGRATAIAGGVTIARDLVNAPAADLSPRRFGEIALEVGEANGFEVSVLKRDEIVAQRLGGLLGVAAGSKEPPRFIRLRYVPEDGADVAVALVGKGITFDSGGLSLKSGTGMMTMKTDMGGAAAVLGAFSALVALGVPVEVRGYLAVTENMPSGSAIRPGDVLTIRNGKTIEVLNTDAEGRLVLADALSVAAEGAPDAIIDLATLTGACVAALGNKIAGVLGNDDRVIDAIRRASARAGEPTWHLPMPAGYRGHIDSEIADMKNIGVANQAGASSAAILLSEFVGDVPWTHLDIAGPVRSEEDRGYVRKGATGFGVRTLLELLGAYEPFGGAVEGEAKGIGVLR